MESKSFFVAYIEFNKLVSRLCCLFTWKIPQTQNMLLAQAIAAQSGKLRDWKTSPKTWNTWKKMFLYIFICFLIFVCFFFSAFLPGFEDGTSILSRIDAGGFRDSLRVQMPTFKASKVAKLGRISLSKTSTCCVCSSEKEESERKKTRKRNWGKILWFKVCFLSRTLQQIF